MAPPIGIASPGESRRERSRRAPAILQVQTALHWAADRSDQALTASLSGQGWLDPGSPHQQDPKTEQG